MTTITRWRARNRHRGRKSAGFTLVELMVSAGLSGFVLAAIMATFLFLGRSGADIRNYSEMEAQARTGLEIFAQDVRQASSIVWVSNVEVRVNVDAVIVTYAYESGTGIFSRRIDPGSRRTLISGITAGSFAFRSFNVTGTELLLTTPAQLAAAGSSTKQLQIALETSRTDKTVVAATNTVLSARYILRNKIVTA